MIWKHFLPWKHQSKSKKSAPILSLLSNTWGSLNQMTEDKMPIINVVLRWHLVFHVRRLLYHLPRALIFSQVSQISHSSFPCQHKTDCYGYSCTLSLFLYHFNQISFILILLNFQEYLTLLITSSLSLAFMTILISFDFSEHHFIVSFTWDNFTLFFLSIP